MTMPNDDVRVDVIPSPAPTETTEQAAGGSRAQIRDMKEQVVEQAKTSLMKARDSAVSSLSDGRIRAAETIGSVASAVRHTGERLRAENRTSVADLTDALADKAERFSSYMRDRDFRGVREDLESFARRRPAVAIGVALAIGILGARFMKSGGGHGGS
jgi:ElaB/YqjD/DUF883 family membrane-anchored ribosome-binding protein